jgi:hypothetical protein
MGKGSSSVLMPTLLAGCGRGCRGTHLLALSCRRSLERARWRTSSSTGDERPARTSTESLARLLVEVEKARFRLTHLLGAIQLNLVWKEFPHFVQQGGSSIPLASARTPSPPSRSPSLADLHRPLPFPRTISYPSSLSPLTFSTRSSRDSTPTDAKNGSRRSRTSVSAGCTAWRRGKRGRRVGWTGTRIKAESDCSLVLRWRSGLYAVRKGCCCGKLFNRGHVATCYSEGFGSSHAGGGVLGAVGRLRGSLHCLEPLRNEQPSLLRSMLSTPCLIAC